MMMSMTPCTVLFDLDDTLYGYEPCNQAGLRATWRLLAQFASGLTYEQFMVVHDEMRDQLAAELGGTAACHNRALFFKMMVERLACESSLAIDLHDLYWQQFLEQARAGAGGPLQTLAELTRRGYLLALVSNHVALPQLRKVKTLGMESSFKAIVTSEEAGAEKPEPRIFERALDRLGVHAEEAVFIGDNPTGDIRGAISAGIGMTILTVEFAWSAVCEEADHTVSTIGEVLEILP